MRVLRVSAVSSSCTVFLLPWDRIFWAGMFSSSLVFSLPNEPRRVIAAPLKQLSAAKVIITCQPFYRGLFFYLPTYLLTLCPSSGVSPSFCLLIWIPSIVTFTRRPTSKHSTMSTYVHFSSSSSSSSIFSFPPLSASLFVVVLSFSPSSYIFHNHVCITLLILQFWTQWHLQSQPFLFLHFFFSVNSLIFQSFHFSTTLLEIVPNSLTFNKSLTDYYPWTLALNLRTLTSSSQWTLIFLFLPIFNDFHPL